MEQHLIPAPMAWEGGPGLRLTSRPQDTASSGGLGLGASRLPPGSLRKAVMPLEPPGQRKLRSESGERSPPQGPVRTLGTAGSSLGGSP